MKCRFQDLGRYRRLSGGGWFFLVALCLPLLGQHQIRFQHLSLEDGLTQSTVSCVLQDSRGFMWIGTHNGLHRFDGHNLIDYRHNPDNPESIANDHITAICEDLQGALWIGTRNGLSKLIQPDLAGGRFVNIAPDRSGLPHGMIISLCADSQGVLWLGTTTGLYRLDAAGARIEPSSAVPSARVTSLLEDASGELWIGTDGQGLYCLDNKRQRTAEYRELEYFAALRYSPEALSAVSNLTTGKEPLIQIAQPGDNAQISRGFQLGEATNLLIVVMGEATDRLFDFGKISHLEEGGQSRPVWEMTAQLTRHAGGAAKNRLQLAVVALPPGAYQVTYASDGSHAPGSWNAPPPDMPEWWGMRVYALAKGQGNTISSLLRGYEHRSNIGSDRITALAEDTDGNLWIGTADRGLRRWHRRQGSFAATRTLHGIGGRRYKTALLGQIDDLMARQKPHAMLAGAGDEADRSTSLRLQKRSKVLLVSTGSAVEGSVFDGASLERNGTQIWAMDYADSAHAGGYRLNRLQVALLDLAPGQYTLRYRTDRFYSPGNWGYGGPDRASLWGVRAFVIDENTAAHWLPMIHDFEEREAIPNRAISALALDPAGHLWVGTSGGGLGAISLDDREFAWFRNDAGRPSSLGSDIIYDLVVDRSGILWAGTELKGISSMDPHKHRFTTYTRNPATVPTLAAEQVFAFFEDDQGYLFIGTDRGLSLLDPAGTGFLPARSDHPLIKSLARTRITCFLRDQHGDLWIGTNRNGLFRTLGTESSQPILQRMNTFRHYYSGRAGNLTSNHITHMLADHEGTVWTGTANGLFRFRNEEFERLNVGSERKQSRDYIRSLLQDSEKRIWVGCDEGLFKIDPASGRGTHYINRPGDADSLSHNIVSALFEDERGIWVGTYGGGLNLLDPAAGKFRRYTEADGLPNNVIYGILPDGEGGLWMSSNKGLSRLDHESDNFQNYDAGDGLQSNEFNSGAFLQLTNGDLVFGGVKGFNLFNPKHIQKPRPAPPIAITAVKAFGRSLKLQQPLAEIAEIELDHTQDFLSFEFVALDYSNPEQNSYAHMLEGYNKDWVPNGNRRFASYTNLDPGRYTFRVKGANDDGTWNETGTALRIHIRPPFWQTWWFRTLTAIFLIAVVISAFNYRVRNLQREKRLQEEFAKRLIQSQEGERRRIASELHDSLGQNLLVINNEIQHQAQLAAERGEADRFGELASLTLDAINEVRDIAYDLHPHQLERLGLKRAVESVINRVTVATECEFHLSSADIDGVFTRDMEINFFRIVQEAVNNILKHAEAANATIEISRDAQAVTVLIRDDGIGFDSRKRDPANDGIGFAGMVERARLLGGRLKIKTEPGAGTELCLAIPLKSERAPRSKTRTVAGAKPRIKTLPP